MEEIHLDENGMPSAPTTIGDTPSVAPDPTSTIEAAATTAADVQIATSGGPGYATPLNGTMFLSTPTDTVGGRGSDST